MKFVHLGDCHLDAPLYDLGQNYNKADLRRHEIKNTFSRVIEFAKEKGVDVILISGDLFEHKYVNKSTIKFLHNQFLEIPNIDIFISPGNHDPIINNSYYSTANWPLNVHIFNKYEKLYCSKCNANIWGVGFGDFYESNCLIKDFDRNEKNKINILIAHGTLDIEQKDGKYHPIDTKHLLEIGFDYCALGHIHKPYFDQKNGICYSGSLEPLGFDESGEHGFIYGEVSKDYKDIQFVNICSRQYYTHNIDVSGLGTIEEIINAIESNIPAKAHDWLNKVILTGEVEVDFIDIKIIEEHFKNYYYIKIVDMTEYSYLLEDIEKENNIKGLFVRKMNNLIKKAEFRDKEMLEKALRCGLDAMTKGEVRF